MPFTPAHPAVILPFLRSKYVSATGLVLGSMSPDFEYFFKFSVSSHHSHSLGGLFYFDLPVTFLLSWLFHNYVKKNLIDNLPAYLQCRFQNVRRVRFNIIITQHLIVFLLSAFAGAATHVLWDAFTHNNTVITRSLSVYKRVFIPYEGVNYPLFYALQHISTAVGLFVILLYILLMKPEPACIVKKPKRSYWLSLIGITAVVAFLRFLIHSSDYQIGNLIVTIISGLCIALLVCGLLNFESINPESRNSNG